MTRKILAAFLLMTMAAMLMLGGCFANRVELTPEQEDQANQVVENCLLGLSEENYQKFSEDFSEQMLSALDLQNFEESLLPLIKGKVGTYKAGTKKLIGANFKEGLISLYYEAEFSRDKVMVTAALDMESSAISIHGLWFDSPQLRK